MGIYIAGIEMPTSCGDCKAFVCYKQWAGDMGDCFCGITKNDAKAKEKNADCPLIAIPPHGKLIDADKIPYNKIMLEDDEFYYGVTKPYIDRMPTIIPASDEDTNVLSKEEANDD